MVRKTLRYGLVRINGNFGLDDKLDDRREEQRREGDQLIYDIRSMMRENEIHRSLDIVLEALKTHGYASPRIYRHRESEDECVLMAYLDLPDQFKDESVRFSVQQNRVLREIINEEHMHYSLDIHTDLREELTENDPLNHIVEKGFITIPYKGESSTYPKQIKGVIVVNYDPEVKIVGTSEFEILEEVGEFVGTQVSRVLEHHEQEKKEKLLEEANIQLEIVNRELEDANAQLEEANVRLEELALRDGLTELYNRRKFHQDLEQYFNDSREKEENHYLGLIDVDKFKGINDGFGHNEGDKVLIHIGSVLEKISNQYKDLTSYRQGGDEFAFAVKSDSLEYVREIAIEIKKQIGKYLLPTGAPIFASIGIDKVSKYDDSFDDWINRADNSLYAAKKEANGIVIN